MISLPKTVGTIGGGNMAEAILQGLLAADTLEGAVLEHPQEQQLRRR